MLTPKNPDSMGNKISVLSIGNEEESRPMTPASRKQDNATNFFFGPFSYEIITKTIKISNA